MGGSRGEPRGEPTVVVLPDADAVARASAERIAAALEETLAARGRAHWATTGGSTPGPIYRRLVESPLRDRVRWEDVHLWWGDDRFVPPDDPLSNTALARSELLPAVPIDPSHVHAVPTGPSIAAGETADECAARYRDELRAAGLPEADGLPAFDVVILGVGPDGHLLSVFPGSAAFDSPDWVQGIPAPTHVEPHVPRVTLHPRILDVARTLLTISHGAAKAEILGSVFGEERDERRWPAQVARRAGATWILDEAAAARLPASGR